MKSGDAGRRIADGHQMGFGGPEVKSIISQVRIDFAYAAIPAELSPP
jgi:hypothetical protein